MLAHIQIKNNIKITSALSEINLARSESFTGNLDLHLLVSKLFRKELECVHTDYSRHII